MLLSRTFPKLYVSLSCPKCSYIRYPAFRINRSNEHTTTSFAVNVSEVKSLQLD